MYKYMQVALHCIKRITNNIESCRSVRILSSDFRTEYITINIYIII